MAFDTFDEGIALGGMRSKGEIKILICYIFNSVKENMDKETIIEAVIGQNLANYFETSAAFDDLIKKGNLTESTVVDNRQTYVLTADGKMIASQLESTLSYTVKQKAYLCAVSLLGEKKKRRENKAEIVKIENGFEVLFRILGGENENDLFTFKLYAPNYEQASAMKKTFFKNPALFYKVILALITEDKETVGEALEDLYGIL